MVCACALLYKSRLQVRCTHISARKLHLVVHYHQLRVHLLMPVNRNLRIHNVHSFGHPEPTLPCLAAGCICHFYNRSGRTTHMRSQHPAEFALGAEEPQPEAPPAHHSESKSFSSHSVTIWQTYCININPHAFTQPTQSGLGSKLAVGRIRKVP
jgi:hypothetical protein